jgi:hypothetical protein
MVVGDWLIAIEDCKSAIQHFELAMEEAKSLWKQLVKLRLFQRFGIVSKAYVGLPLSIETLILAKRCVEYALSYCKGKQLQNENREMIPQEVKTTVNQSCDLLIKLGIILKSFPN